MRTILLSMAGLILSACSVFGYNHGVDEPSYTVTQSEPPIEIREYDTIVLVATSGTGDFDSSQDQAFQRLFDYISGDNIAAQNIEMTAPVLMSEEEAGQEIPMTAPVFMDENDGGWQMSFVLPVDMTLETAPQPTHEKVKLEKRPARKVAVLEFSGFFDEERMKTKEEVLRSWIAENDYQVAGDASWAGYNPPWTLPPLRRNEIHIPVE